MIDRLSRSQAKMKRREHSYIERITTWDPELGNDDDDKQNFINTSGLEKLSTL